MICMSGNVNEFERKNNNHSHSRSSSNHRMIENCKKKGEQIRDGRILFKQNPITMKLELRVFYFQFSIYLFIFYLFIYSFVSLLCQPFTLFAIHIPLLFTDALLAMKYTKENVFIINSMLFALRISRCLRMYR